jgi:hypothetical protein
MGHYVLNPGSALLWDIKNDKKTELLHEQGEELLGFSVSPDHKWLVYDGRKNSRRDRVIVTDSNGKVLRNIDGYNWFFPLGWLNNQNLAIWMLSDVTDGPPFPTLVYNPFTRDSKLVMPDYPDIYWWHIPNWASTLTVYDPSANFVVYITQAGNENGNGSVVLWDINAKHEIVKLKDLAVINNNNAPLWSPNGQEFLIDAKLENHSSFELYAINLQGTIQQLTHFENLTDQPTSANLTLWNYSWSGDGRYIAFWYRIGAGKAAQLVLLDTLNNNIKDLCVKSYWHFPPIWSPDNEQFLVDGFLLNESETTNYKTLLVDINDNYVVKIAEDVLPEGWLLDEH